MSNSISWSKALNEFSMLTTDKVGLHNFFKPFILTFSILKYEPARRIPLKRGAIALKTAIPYSLKKIAI